MLLCAGVAPAQSLGRPVPAVYTGAPAAAPPVQRTAMFQQADDVSEFDFDLDLPSDQRVLSRLESEATLQLRLRMKDTDKGKPPPQFPETPILSKQQYFGRKWPQSVCTAEPNFVCYGRLLFEQKNFERYGWDLGVLGPVFETMTFGKDMVLLPYHLATDPFRCFETSAGYCMPGDPVPLLLYPPELSATGAVAEAGVIVGLIAIFP
jgi:hypothetical protein